MRQAARPRWLALIVLTALALPATSQSQPEAPRWRPIGPWGGSASVLVADPFHVNRFWGVAAFTAHLHRSDDGGQSWTWLGRGPGEGAISLLVPSPHAADLLLAAAGNLGVWRSRDGGHTWEEARQGLPVGGPQGFNSINALVYDPVRPGVAYALTAGGYVFETRDDGGRWEGKRWASLPGGSLGALMDVTVDGHLLLVLQGSAYLCSPALSSCVKVLEGLSGRPLALAALPAGAGVWLADGEAVWRSADGGLSWEDASAGLADVPERSWPLRDFRFDPASREVYALCETGLLRWLASERRWELADRRVRSFWIPERRTGWAVGVGEHLFGYGDFDAPIAWRGADQALEERKNGFAGKGTLAVALDPRSGEVIAAATGSGALYRDAAGDWQQSLSVSYTFSATFAHAPSPRRELLLALAGGLYSSLDQGRTWDVIPIPFETSGANVERIPIVFPSQQRILIADAGYYLWRSENWGATWWNHPTRVEMLAVHPNNPGLVWAAKQFSLVVSRDGGQTWSGEATAGQATAGAACPPGWCWTNTVTAMAADPFAGDRVFLGTKASGLWVSEGGSRRQLDARLGWVAGIVADGERRGRLLVGGGQGWTTLPFGAVVASEDGGQSWQPVGANGADLPYVWDLAVSFPHGRYAVATQGGVFVLEDTPRDNRPLRRGGPTRR